MAGWILRSINGDFWTRCPEVDRELLLIRETGKRGRGKYPDGFRQEEYSLSYHKAVGNNLTAESLKPIFGTAMENVLESHDQKVA